MKNKNAQTNPGDINHASPHYYKKYRVQSTRLPQWDYSWDGMYFLTICVKDVELPFGHIIDGKVQLSQLGEAAYQCWLEIPSHFPFVKLDEFIIMPDHVHGIIEINKTTHHVQTNPVETHNHASLRHAPPHHASPHHASPHHASKRHASPHGHNFNTFGPQSQNLASVIRGFKIGVKKYAKMNGELFSWQPRFYDHIIRDDKDLNRVRKYIRDNPLKRSQT